MINMMTDLLQYVPYALLIGAVFTLLFGGVIYTILYFRKAETIKTKRATVNQ